MSSQKPFRSLLSKPLFVAFAGHMGSGKTSAAEYLRSTYSFQYARYSAVLREWLTPREPSRDELRVFGWEVMSGGRQGELNTALIASIERCRSAAIEGLRHPIDFDSLANAFAPSLHLIFIHADDELRFRRLRSRFATRQEFASAMEHPVEASINQLQPRADITLANESSLDDLHKSLDTWLAARLQE
jgi:dephospho-CoA kinase